MNLQPIKLPFYARLSFSLLSIILGLFLLIQGRDIFIPLVFALLISILLYPIHKFLLEKFHFGRSLSAITCITIFLGALASLFAFLSSELVLFFEDFPDLKVRFTVIFANLQHWLSHKMHINNAQQTDYINKSLNGVVESAAKGVSNVFLSMTSVLLLAIFVIIFTFFMLYHHKLLLKFTQQLFSEEYQTKVKEVIMETKSMINGYVVGLLTEMVIMSVANSVLLMFMHVPFAILLGVLAAVLNIIPYIGIYSSIVLIMFVTFANTTAQLAGEVGIGMFILHFLDSNILLPKIVGSRVKMNPFITIVAVVIGEFIWGIPGMFLFIPLVGITKLICERVEGLEAWGLLIGVDDTMKKAKPIVVPPAPPAENEPADQQSDS